MSIKIYTKTGDKGQTSLLGGKKVAKSSIRIESYGNIDELNSFIGLLKDQPEVEAKIKQQFYWIQEHLFSIGSILASENGFSGFELPQIGETHIKQLEVWIDKYTTELPELKNFILPGGHQVVSLCHVCRTVCRRAERSITQLHSEEPVDEHIIPFINRLSDYFFVMSRKMSQILQIAEVPWKPQLDD
ncbi:cob(I)yrinic acid a,c-diamide adenosyltransferase [Marinoscillum sp. MHG1-6]|uniref:cob(I)yrinic acid a,c-diamide adenosyltransferase n=1 Tax=Marinoscillum sp. MHG1-6 TaxID=2959627 RepID=UPI00280AFD48|nr:cob(I)yrinic acid a,c-diamide adenosyltransferase [Marinoscillum sp. MHG1-6]